MLCCHSECRGIVLYDGDDGDDDDDVCDDDDVHVFFKKVLINSSRNSLNISINLICRQ